MSADDNRQQQGVTVGRVEFSPTSPHLALNITSSQVEALRRQLRETRQYTQGLEKTIVDAEEAGAALGYPEAACYLADIITDLGKRLSPASPPPDKDAEIARLRDQIAFLKGQVAALEAAGGEVVDERFIEMVERWRASGVEANHCAHDLLVFCTDSFNRGDQEPFVMSHKTTWDVAFQAGVASMTVSGPPDGCYESTPGLYHGERRKDERRKVPTSLRRSSFSTTP